MLRRIGLTAVAVALGFGGAAAAFASPAGAAKPDLGNATGNVTCQITAKVKISPPLKDSVVAPNLTPSTTTAKTKSTSCTSNGGTIGTFMNGGKSKGLVTSTGTEPGTCTGLAEPGDTPFTSEITWKPSGAKANGSSITFANVGATETLDGFLLPAAGETGKGTSVITGSFAGHTAWAFANLGGLPDISKCFDVTTVKPGKNGKPDKVKTKAAKGLKKLVVVSGHITIEMP
jgi:hypothetical protein